MKFLKHNKGITLVALTITIIVLLILAVVSINAVQSDGLISHAKNSQQKYEDEVENENTMLQNYMKYLSSKGGTEKKKIKFRIYISEYNDYIECTTKEGMKYKDFFSTNKEFTTKYDNSDIKFIFEVKIDSINVKSEGMDECTLVTQKDGTIEVKPNDIITSNTTIWLSSYFL